MHILLSLVAKNQLQHKNQSEWQYIVFYLSSSFLLEWPEGQQGIFVKTVNFTNTGLYHNS